MNKETAFMPKKIIHFIKKRSGLGILFRNRLFNSVSNKSLEL